MKTIKHVYSQADRNVARELFIQHFQYDDCRLGSKVSCDFNKLFTYHKPIVVLPSPGNKLGFMRLNLTQTMLRPQLKNVTSCHRMDGEHYPGGQFGYITDPNWATYGIFMRPTKDFRVTYTNIDNDDEEEEEYKPSYYHLAKANPNLVNTPNFVTTINVCLGTAVDINGNSVRAVFLSRVYGDPGYAKATYDLLGKHFRELGYVVLVTPIKRYFWANNVICPTTDEYTLNHQTGQLLSEEKFVHFVSRPIKPLVTLKQKFDLSCMHDSSPLVNGPTYNTLSQLNETLPYRYFDIDEPCIIIKDGKIESMFEAHSWLSLLYKDDKERFVGSRVRGFHNIDWSLVNRSRIPGTYMFDYDDNKSTITHICDGCGGVMLPNLSTTNKFNVMSSHNLCSVDDMLNNRTDVTYPFMLCGGCDPFGYGRTSNVYVMRSAYSTYFNAMEAYKRGVLVIKLSFTELKDGSLKDSLGYASVLTADTPHPRHSVDLLGDGNQLTVEVDLTGLNATRAKAKQCPLEDGYVVYEHTQYEIDVVRYVESIRDSLTEFIKDMLNPYTMADYVTYKSNVFAPDSDFVKKVVVQTSREPKGIDTGIPTSTNPAYTVGSSSAYNDFITALSLSDDVF